jgi:hypothetical protein
MTEQEWGRRPPGPSPWGVRLTCERKPYSRRSTMVTLEYFAHPRNSPRQGPAPFLESPAGHAEALFGIAFADMEASVRPTARLRQMMDRVIYARLVTAVKCHR